MQHAAEAAQASYQKQDEVLNSLKIEISQKLDSAKKTIETMLVGEDARLNAAQKAMLRSSVDNMVEILGSLEAIKPPA